MSETTNHSTDPAQPHLGILMLDTAFPRIRGDVGNPASYPFPVQLAIVPGAGSLDIVRDGRPSPDLASGFLSAAQHLADNGAQALISSCGFLVSLQAEIAQAVSIPVMLSALSLHPFLKTLHGGRPIGILTASAPNLGPMALKAAGIADSDTGLIAGLEGSTAFRTAILANKAEQGGLDAHAIAHDVVDRARELLRLQPDMACFLLECGNLPPYAADIRAATGKPVYSILDGAVLMMRASAHSRAGSSWN